MRTTEYHPVGEEEDQGRGEQNITPWGKRKTRDEENRRDDTGKRRKGRENVESQKKKKKKKSSEGN